jgi:hypothetical protein
MNRQQARRRAAFTLIELVASAVLAAMMMAALLSIVWSAIRESNQLRASSAGRFPFTLLADQLRCDFHNARGMLVDPGGITLHGFLARDPNTRQPLLVPGRVRYEVRTVGNRRLLTRRFNASSAEPLWMAVSSFEVEPLADLDPEEAPRPLPETGGLPELPLVFRVTLRGDQGRVLWQEVIHHHES